MILHGIDVAQRNPLRELCVFSPDTDVFLLLIHYYNGLPTRTKFITGKVNARRSIDIGKAFEALRSEKRAALLGFHAFTGCDQTSKLNGNSKLTCWKFLMIHSPISFQHLKILEVK